MDPNCQAPSVRCPTTAELLTDATLAYQAALQFARLHQGSRGIDTQPLEVLSAQVERLKQQLQIEQAGPAGMAVLVRLGDASDDGPRRRWPFGF